MVSLAMVVVAFDYLVGYRNPIWCVCQTFKSCETSVGHTRVHLHGLCNRVDLTSHVKEDKKKR